MELFTPPETAATILIHVIEYFSEGFLILNERKEILLVNDALLRTIGQRSTFFIDHSEHIVSCLPLSREPYTEHPVVLPVGGTRKCLFMCTYFFFSHEAKNFYIIKLTPAMNLRMPETEQVRSLVDDIESPAVSFDGDGLIISMNEAFRELLEFGEDFNPESLLEHCAHPDQFREKLSRLNGSSKAHELETVMKTAGGRSITLIETIRVLHGESGQAIGYLSSFRDISRLRALEDQLRTSQTNYRRLFEIVTSPVIVLNEEGQVVNMNGSAEQLYRCRRDSMIGINYDDFFRGGKKRPEFRTLLGKARDQGGKYAEIGTPRRRSDGALIYTYATYTVVEKDEVNPFALFIMEKDLTARVKLEKRLEDTLRRVRETQAAAILGFARITEYRDHTTGNHLRRIMLYTEMLARKLKKLPKYRNYMKGDYLESLSLSAVLHDIGKVGIEDSILLKPGKLTEEEYDRMKQHTALGGEALRAIDKELSYESFLTIGKEVAWYHHERWDGTGYPEGRKGDEIPLSARIVALADVYDALTSDRVYKSAYSHDEAVEYIEAERGKHFDPDVVDVFLSSGETFRRIREKLSDNSQITEDRIEGSAARRFSVMNLDNYYRKKKLRRQRLSALSNEQDPSIPGSNDPETGVGESGAPADQDGKT